MVQSPAGSGKTVVMSDVARKTTEKDNNVLFIVHRREIVEQVKKTFEANDVEKDRCHIGMVQTVKNNLAKIKKPQLILVDEAHHSLAKTYKDIFEYFPDAYVLGFTATPVRLSGAGFEKIYSDLILGKSVKWLIENNRLAGFKYFSVDLMDQAKLKHNSTGDFSNESINEASKSVIYGDVVKEYEKLANGTKAIVYTHSVEASKQVADAFNDSGHPAKQVDGKTAKEERAQAMEDFRSGKIKILTNAELYGEGVDVPDCQTVILLRPTESLSLFIQQTMRAMRYQPNKVATIIDHVANYTRHGLPDTPHDWKLNGRKKKKTNAGSDAVPIKQCPMCMAVMYSTVKVCECGHEFIEEAREIKIEAAELTEITSDLKFQTNYIITKRVDELHTVEDLKAYQKAKGYKNGWVYHQAKQKGLIK